MVTESPVYGEGQPAPDPGYSNALASRSEVTPKTPEPPPPSEAAS